MRNRIQPNEPIHLPQPTAPVPPPGAFVHCSLENLPGMTPEQIQNQQQLYKLALEQAQQVARPSLPERDILGNWN